MTTKSNANRVATRAELANLSTEGPVFCEEEKTWLESKQGQWVPTNAMMARIKLARENG